MPESKSYRVLMASARERLEQGHPSEAVIIAQTAAELCAEQAFDTLYERRGISDLKTVLARLLYSNFNLAHDRVAALYEALSGAEIKQQPWWSRYKAHNELRNDIVHDGRQVSADEAQESLDVVGELIDYLTA